jgi:hypothetical protein
MFVYATTDTIKVTPLAPPRGYFQTAFSSADTDSIPFRRELDALLTAENVDGYVFQPSIHAHRHAKAYLSVASRIMKQFFPRPELISDGEGGIDIEWTKNARKVSLSCRGTDAQSDYIYWEEGGNYDARDFALLLLIYRLNWLNHA